MWKAGCFQVWINLFVIVYKAEENKVITQKQNQSEVNWSQ